MDETPNFKSLQDKIQAALIPTTRTSGQISSEDLGFQRSLNSEVGSSLDEQSARLLALSNALLKSATSLSALSTPTLEDAEDVDNNWRNVVDVVDSLLEKADTSLDEYTGVIKRKDTTSVDQVLSKPKKQSYSLGNAFRTQNLVKPQLAFDMKPDNSDNSPWKPLLSTKPHAAISLEDSLSMFINDFEQKQYDYTDFLPLLTLPPVTSKPEGLSKQQRINHGRRVQNLRNAGSTKGRTDNRTRYRHPYETEILKLKYPDVVYQTADPIPYQPVETTSAIFVDTPEAVLEMLEELKTATEIAVDLEHHDHRSYVGLVSLMQISTRSKDWIIDTLKPWRQDLQILNQVFADPNIVKVFHGAYMDIVWLQRDFGLYVVGLFDTHWASRTLGYQGGSLAFLLKKFIGFDADKKYQMADWRIRPLPEEMFFYARADTHYLLYIYDMMRNELIDRSNPAVPEENKMELVLQKSKETSLLRYERQIYNAESGKGPGGWYSLLAKTPSFLSNEQFAVFKAVHEWRDKIARIDDDSPSFVMPQQAVFSIAKIVPTDMVALLGTAHPISHSVKSRAGELLVVVKEAKARGKDGPTMIDVLRPNSVGAIAKANLPSAVAKNSPNTLVAVIDDTQLRSEESTFWGGAFGSSIWDAPSDTKVGDSLRLAVPLPALSSEIFQTSNVWAEQSQPLVRLPSQAVQTPTSTPTPKKEDEAFVLKRGGKRKSEAISEPEETTGEYDISLNDEEDEAVRERAERKAAHKAEKKAAKRARKAQQILELGVSDSGDVNQDEDNQEAFDYSKAESVLHGKRNGGDKGVGTKAQKGQKPFDPYQKSADAPKGMRRLQTERAGKSHTFKS